MVTPKPRPTLPQALLRLFRLLRPKSRQLLCLLALIVVAASLDVAVPFFAQHLIDGIVHSLGHEYAPALRMLLLSACAIFVATATTRVVRSVYNFQLFKTMAQVEDRLKTAAFANFLHLDTAFQKSVNTGEVIGSLDRGGTAVFVVLCELLGQSLIPPTMVFAGVLAALVAKNLWVALAVFLPLPIYVLTVNRLGNRMQATEEGVNDAFEKVSKESYDIASNAAVVKKFGREKQEAALQTDLLTNARNKQLSAERLWACVENAQSGIATLGRVVVIALGGYLVLTRRASVGDFFLFIALQDMVYQPVSQLSVILPKLRRNLARAQRMFDILDQQTSVPESPRALPLASFRHSVEFRDVSFRYPGSDRWTLRNVSFRVSAGQTVALIGRSGTGKSTLVSLLQRCYDPQAGSILIDGVDIRQATQESLRQQMAIVPQEVDLFSRSIFENIAYGRPNAGEQDVIEAAQIAQAHQFISRSEDGYETEVGERGLKLSGGERQRLGIARALLRDPRILILDEATSHLDNQSERLIQEASQKIMDNRTCFVIAHRLSTIRNADTVVVFGDSGVEAIGTHETLWNSSAAYRRLYAPVSELEEVQPATIAA